MIKRFKTPGRATPRSNRRGCLCPDGTYSRKCCDGSLQSQGVGKIKGESPSEDEYYYRVQRCDHSMRKEIHLHDTELVVGNVYYLEFENSGHSNCYTVLNVSSSGEHHIESATLYNDCDACSAAN
jgi:hypothetical protein